MFVCGGNMSEHIDNVTSERVVVAVSGKVDLEKLLHLFERDGSVDRPGTVGQRADFFLLVVVFVLNIADNRFDEILHRDHAGSAAVFVNHDGDLHLFLIETRK